MSVACSVIQNPDHCVGQLDDLGRVLRQMLVGFALTSALKGLRDFTVNQRQHLALVPLQALAVWGVPPAMIKLVNVRAEQGEYAYYIPLIRFNPTPRVRRSFLPGFHLISPSGLNLGGFLPFAAAVAMSCWVTWMPQFQPILASPGTI